MVKMIAGGLLHVKLAIEITMKKEVDKIKINYRKLHTKDETKNKKTALFSLTPVFRQFGVSYTMLLT